MQTPHILIVEDELVTRNTLKVFSKQKVTMYSKRPMARKCIRSCLKMISTTVIMDINLPGKMVFCWRASCASRQTSR